MKTRSEETHRHYEAIVAAQAFFLQQLADLREDYALKKEVNEMRKWDIFKLQSTCMALGNALDFINSLYEWPAKESGAASASS